MFLGFCTNVRLCVDSDAPAADHPLVFGWGHPTARSTTAPYLLSVCLYRDAPATDHLLEPARDSASEREPEELRVDGVRTPQHHRA